MHGIYNAIYRHVSGLEIIDTHEHLPFSENAREKDTDVLKEYLRHYFSRDLISAGLKLCDFEKAVDCSLPLEYRWKLVEPYWAAARHTGYGRALDIAVKELYGIEKICGPAIEELNARFQKSLQPGHFKKVLKDKSKIKVSLLDEGNRTDCDKEFFRCVYRLDNFVMINSGAEINHVERETGIKICSFDDWLDACEMQLDKALKQGIAALKSALAYIRPLKYRRTGRNEAEKEFNELWGNYCHIREPEQRILPGRAFQDYMMHFILRLANKRNLTFQFHTGLQEGNGNFIGNSDPALLSNLFLEYPDVNFDIFHISYPYQQVLSVLAKNFPNVYIDMCWAHIISPTACVNALAEWIDSVPLNKISAFGGDYAFIDGVYGHQHLARINVSKALAVKVHEGVLEPEEAMEAAEMFFYKNPLNLFKL